MDFVALVETVLQGVEYYDICHAVSINHSNKISSLV